MSTRNPFDYLINGASLLTSVRIQFPLIVRTIANPQDSDLQIVNPFREVSVLIEFRELTRENNYSDNA